jgi:deazaflavin-dependent oxidoreductase (nitroreductase family)
MRRGNAFNTWVYRRSRGRRMGKIKGLPVLLLTVRGRKTGVPHTVPVTYLREGASWIVIGSAGGMPEEPQWFRNLRATERAVVEVGADRHDVTVAVANPELRDELWQRVIAVAPFFEGYQKKASRVIPIALLTPQ